jgi:hypothetical protein
MKTKDCNKAIKLTDEIGAMYLGILFNHSNNEII